MISFTVYYARRTRVGLKDFRRVIWPRMYQADNGDHIVDIKYGYNYQTTEHFEDFASVLPGKKYKIMHQTLPKEGDILVHEKSGRRFVLGADMDGFLIHMFPMMENGRVVAYLRAEDYYKD